MTTSRRPRQTREQWKRLIDRYNEGQQEAGQFCKTHDLGYSTFYKWKRTFSRPTEPLSSAAKPDFVELSPPSLAPVESWDVELTLGHGMQLRLRTR